MTEDKKTIDDLVKSVDIQKKMIDGLLKKVPPNYGYTAGKVIDERYGGYVKTFIGQPKNKVFAYDEKLGYWKEVDDEIIFRDIQQIAGKHISSSYRTSAYEYLRTEALDTNNGHNPYHIEGQLHYNGKLTLNNGVYDINKHQFFKGKYPGSFSIYHLSIIYDLDADTKPIKDYVTTLATSKWEPTVQEMLGKILLGNHKVKKMFLPYGEPDTGKTKLITILAKLIGDDNCSHYTLEALSDPFTVVKLARILLNTAPEIGGVIKINNIGIIKSITGEDILEKRLMHSQKTVKLYCIATNIFAINKIPHLSQKTREQADDGFYSRHQFIPFTHVFKRKERDTNIVEKMTTPTMCSAWFNYFIEGAKRLEENDWVLTNEQDVDDVITIYNKGRVFTEMEEFSVKYYEWNPDKLVWAKDEYEFYKDIKLAEKEVPSTYHVFVREFNKHCVWKIKPEWKKRNSKPERIFKGIERRKA